MRNTLTPEEQKKIVILYRAATFYGRSSVQNVVRFLMPRVPLPAATGSMQGEVGAAIQWWNIILDDHQRYLFSIQYKFAAKTA